jgi:hypothetical protein
MGKKTEKITEVIGFIYKTESGSVVHMNHNNPQKVVGDQVCYTSIKSNKSVRYQAGNTQWVESKAIGPVFNKEI